MARSKPDDYVPPYPAFQAHPRAGFEQVTLTMFGIQSSDAQAAEQAVAEFRGLSRCENPTKPLHVEQGWHVDLTGCRNDVLMLYWRAPAQMREFWQRPDVAGWLARPLTGPVGWWRESLHAAKTSLDGNYSIPDVRYGISRYSEQREEQFHGYFGSMRDRVPDFASGQADGTPGQLQWHQLPDARALRLRIIDPPDRLCFIRGAFAWEEAQPEEQAVYQEQMYPVYKEGSDWLTAHPIESNCISMRLVEEVRSEFDNGVQVESLGWFLTLKDLERWTHHHPRHVAIMKNIMSYMQRFNFKPRLNLGHEVIVVPQGQGVFEYCNCHAKTGFLPFFASASV